MFCPGNARRTCRPRSATITSTSTSPRASTPSSRCSPRPRARRRASARTAAPTPRTSRCRTSRRGSACCSRTCSRSCCRGCAAGAGSSSSSAAATHVFPFLPLSLSHPHNKPPCISSTGGDKVGRRLFHAVCVRSPPQKQRGSGGIKAPSRPQRSALQARALCYACRLSAQRTNEYEEGVTILLLQAHQHPSLPCP